MWQEIEFASIYPHSLQKGTWVEIKVRGRGLWKKVVYMNAIFLSPIFAFTYLPSLCHSGREGSASLVSSRKRVISRRSLTRLVLHPRGLVEYLCWATLMKSKDRDYAARTAGNNLEFMKAKNAWIWDKLLVLKELKTPHFSFKRQLKEKGLRTQGRNYETTEDGK